MTSSSRSNLCKLLTSAFPQLTARLSSMELVPIRVDFGGDPLRILGGGTDGFGASGGVGVGVSVEGGDELGHLP